MILDDIVWTKKTENRHWTKANKKSYLRMCRKHFCFYKTFFLENFLSKISTLTIFFAYFVLYWCLEIVYLSKLN